MGNRDSFEYNREGLKYNMFLCMNLQLGAKEALRCWKSEYADHTSRDDFYSVEGKLGEILYSAKSIIVFTLNEHKEDFILLAESTTHFELYKATIRSHPVCFLRLKLWRGHLYEDFSFVKGVTALWAAPTGLQLTLYLKDGTEYNLNSNDIELTRLITTTIKENIQCGHIKDELSLMLKHR